MQINMQKSLASSAFVLFLSGCAIPVPLQIASWALDGLSVLTTQKSVADHAISIAADKDCAVWRGFTEGQICREIDDNTATAVADAGTTPDTLALADPENLPESLNVGDIDELPGFVTASGSELIAEDDTALTDKDREVASLTALPETGEDDPGENISGSVLSATRAAVDGDILAEINVDTDTSETVGYNASRQPAPVVQTASIVAEKQKVNSGVNAGIYYVIGSFRNFDNASRMQKNHSNLSPQILTARTNIKTTYRVVVGPTRTDTMKYIYHSIAQAGITDTWAIRVTSDEWKLANSDTRPELASIGE